MALCLATGVVLTACGGSDSQGPVTNETKLLADGETCNAAWVSTTAYVGGNKVSYAGRNYTAAYWTQNNNPATSSGPAGSGQPWIPGYLCGGTTTTTKATTTTTKAATTTTKASTTTTKASTTTTKATTTTTVISSCPAYVAGTAYASGKTVTNAGGYYTCDVSGWCSSGATAYEPGVGWAWSSAWHSASASACGGTTTTTKAATTTTKAATTTTTTKATTTTTLAGGYKLVWSDEFNNATIDTTKWSFEVNGGGGGNNELQYYTSRPENLRVTGGNLVIEARKETYTGPDGTRNYTSGRMNTKGKASWTYGRMEGRMKLPSGQGIWPAFWMLGNSLDSVGWPKSGEIDIMERINNEGFTHGTIHWWDHNNAYANYGGPSFGVDFSQFHVYAVEWDSGAVRWYIDGAKFWEASIAGGVNGTEEFHQPFFAILNLAVGGNWPGNPDASTVFPAQVLVDYVRVYQK